MRLQEQSELALREIRAAAANGQIVAFVSGNFNVVHPGHVRLLNFAAECADFLVVAVNGQSSNGSLLPAELRLESVRSISFVDYAFVLRDRSEHIIEALKPAVVVKGKEFEGRFNVEQAAVDKYGGKLLFGSGEITFSSLDLIRREFSDLNLSTIVKPSDFPARHGFEFSDLNVLLGKMSELHVTVIGDLIVDEYIACDPVGMSQEDPTLVVTPVLNERFVGGAGIVAAHSRGLGASVTFISAIGRDPAAEFAAERLKNYGVTPVLFEDDSRPTTLKQRYRAGGQTLLRVSHMRQHGVSQEKQQQILEAARSSIMQSDLVIFSDFNYGCLPQPLVDTIVAFCKRRGVPMVADSQSSSQVGDVSRFKGMKLLKPTEREARLALRDFDSGLVVVAESLGRKAEAENIILTLGQEGLLIHANEKPGGGWLTDKLPSFNTAPRDPAGAGDSLLTCASLALVAGGSIWESAYIGSLAAACQVGRVGNLPLTSNELKAEIEAF
jgi:rfaE bifunctional protein kinase chain/domain